MKEHAKKITLVATAITTLLSATVSIAAVICANKASTTNDKLKRENGELKDVLEGLSNIGTITWAQEVAIRGALATAKEVAIANAEILGGENGKHEAVFHRSKIGTLTRLKKSVFKVRSQHLKKPAQSTGI